LVSFKEESRLRRKFLVQGKFDESRLGAILAPILMGTSRTTHKIIFKTSKGVVEYISIPLGTNLGRYSAVGVSDMLHKIVLWNKDNTAELEEILRSNSMKIVQIVKDGPGTLELKK
jgi:hypothetical protein